MSQVPSITLNNGLEMPQLGYGVWQVPDDEATTAVATAIESGYRSIDTAAIYGNEEGTGKAIAASGVARDELFVTTKLWNGDQGYDSTLRAFDASLDKLGLDYVDLYLIHWPLLYQGRLRRHVQGPREDPCRRPGQGHRRVELPPRASGAPDRRDLRRPGGQPDRAAPPTPAGGGPRLPRAARHRHRGLVPLGQGKGLDVPTVVAIARKHGRTPAQAVLRWHLQTGHVAIPKSVTPSRIVENLDVFGFELDADDLAAFAALDEGKRIGPDPAEFAVGA